jgi:group II intron reverse transcriptase/maturase
LESVFVPDSYGFRPGRGALDAVEMARRRCRQYDWVVDLDISKFFDSVDHELLLQVVQWQGWPRWAVICVERWITAPMVDADGQVSPRDKGTPQGGVVSPVLANLFLHVVFDLWMGREFPDVLFERYADDAICHCATRRVAQQLVERLEQRFVECGLKLHPVKTKIVYCKDSDRRGNGLGPTRFVFLGFEFRARKVRGKYGVFDRFGPGIDPVKRDGLIMVIRGWRLPSKMGHRLVDLARLINPILRGWMNYYARFCADEFAVVLHYLNARLFKWMRKKYRHRSVKKALRVWKQITKVSRIFVHWQGPHPNTFVFAN